MRTIEIAIPEQIQAFLSLDTQTRQYIINLVNIARVKKAPTRIKKSMQMIPTVKIVLAACSVLRIMPMQFISPTRKKRIVWGRSIICDILRGQGLSLPAIGQILGNRNHSTIIHALERHDELLAKKLEYQSLYTRIMSELKNNTNKNVYEIA